MQAEEMGQVFLFQLRKNIRQLQLVLLSGWLALAGLGADRLVDTSRPAPSPVEKIAKEWEDKFALENYVPATPLEKSLHLYFKQLLKACGMAAGGDMSDISRIVGRARKEMTGDTERLIQEFVAAGYQRADAEVYFDRLYARLQRDLALYFGHEASTPRKAIKPKDAPVSDDLLAKAEVLFYGEKDSVGALQMLENALRFAPNNVRLTLDTALRQQASGQLAEARANFDLAREGYPKVVHIHIGMGDIRMAAHDYLGAIADLTTAIYLEPGALRAYSLRGMARQILEDYEGAIDDYSLQIASGNRMGQAEVYMHRGQAHYELGRIEIARADFKAAIRLEPNNPYGHLLLGRLLSNEGKPQEALAAINKAIELRPNAPEGYDVRLWVLLELGENEFALRDVERLVTMIPDNIFFGLVRASVLNLIDRPEAAESEYRRTIELAKRKGDNRTWYYASLHLDMFLRRQGRAEPEYLRDVVDWPDEWPKRIALHLTGRITAESLLNAARQAPTRSGRLSQECEANFYIGMALWSAGDRSAAEPYLRVATQPQYAGNMEQTLARKLLRQFDPLVPAAALKVDPPAGGIHPKQEP